MMAKRSQPNSAEERVILTTSIFGLICNTMQQSVEQSWSKLHGDVRSSTLYCSVHGNLSRTSFSTFQSVSWERKTRFNDSKGIAALIIQRGMCVLCNIFDRNGIHNRTLSIL